jgi:hypothetical protein
MRFFPRLERSWGLVNNILRLCGFATFPLLDGIILGGGDDDGSLYTRTLGSQNHYLGVKAHELYIKLQGFVPIMLLLRRGLYECYEWPYVSRAGELQS